MAEKCWVWFAAGLFCIISEFGQGEQANSLSEYGQVSVANVIRVDSQCQIYCDIANWPAIIGKEIPVRIRGLDSQQVFSVGVRQFIMETLTNALVITKKSSDPNQPESKGIILKNIQRGQTFCLVADIEVSGGDLGQMLVDKGFAKKMIVPKNAGSENPPLSGENSVPAKENESAQITEGYVASKSGKVFHKASCSHARRISDKTKITYPTRDEAVNSGRRPCQTCNP